MFCSWSICSIITTGDTVNTCIDCGVEVSQYSKRCCSCGRKRELALERAYRVRRREKLGKPSREESILVAKRIVDQYLAEKGPKRMLYTHYIYDFGVERGLFPHDWSYQKRMSMVAMAIPKHFTYKRSTDRSYCYTMVQES